MVRKTTTKRTQRSSVSGKRKMIKIQAVYRTGPFASKSLADKAIREIRTQFKSASTTEPKAVKSRNGAGKEYIFTTTFTAYANNATEKATFIKKAQSNGAYSVKSSNVSI